MSPALAIRHAPSPWGIRVIRYAAYAVAPA
jgi:hypothetical protein